MAKAYSLATGDVKGGLTKKQYLTGNIPVTPFTAANVGSTNFTVVWSHPNRALFQIDLVCKGTAKTCVRPSETFDIGLVRAGGKPNGRWLVNYWVPVDSGIGIKPSVGG
jgi:hypothetical protein